MHRCLVTSRILAFTCLSFALALLIVDTAEASWQIYGSMDFGYSAGNGKVSGFTTQSLPDPTFSGRDENVSPLLGGAIGIEVPLDELTPWPKPFDRFRLPTWPFRFEIQVTGLREYRLRSNGLAPNGPNSFDFFTTAKSWSWMHNFWIDVPLAGLHKPIMKASRRVFDRPRLPRLKRWLDPASLYFGFGLGFANLRIHSTNSVWTGKREIYDFAYQFGIGAGYQITKNVNLGFGYRYHGLSSAKVKLRDSVGGNVGRVKLRTDVHEARFSMRVRFARLPYPWR